MRLVILTACVAIAASPVLADEKNPKPEPTKTAAQENSSDTFKPPKGYKIKKRGDEMVYCEKRSVTGSRFPEEFCFTEAQLRDLVRRSQSIRDDVAQRQKMCSTGTACAGT